mgnify:CR=1 FL=1
MFLSGTIIGIGSELNTGADNHVHQTIQQWGNIDSEVLLLVFLPGLIFKDAYGLQVHIFRVALGQCVISAFPMVLAGTSLTALVAYYIFPFDWSFNLAMTFGSILSATDPVAVAALLQQVGAPPRLKTHIAGEALLNDGSAIVFFYIFSERYYAELGVVDFGEDIGFKEGVAVFFQKSLGAVAVGIFFAMVLLALLYLLDHKLSRENNIVQVSVVRLCCCMFACVLAPVVLKMLLVTDGCCGLSWLLRS